jgi:predicted lipoprotein with Yx(FWY)xxD motif
VNGVGTVLVNSSGRTLYMLTADKGDRVTCTSTACTASWPPVLVSSAPSPGAGVSASILGTAQTPSGKMQATYGGWPLYAYSGDLASGQANGQDIVSFGGVWHPLATSGSPVTSGSSASTGGGGW